MNNGMMVDVIEEKESRIDIKEVFFKYLSYWPLFVGTLFICLTGAFLYNYFTPHEYKIQETIMISDNSNNAGDNFLAELDVFKSQKIIENEIEILKSKTLISKAVKSLETDIVYFQKRGLRTIELYKSCPFIVTTIQKSPEIENQLFQIRIIDNSSFQLSVELREGGTDLNNKQYKFGEKISIPEGDFIVERRFVSDNLSPYAQSDFLFFFSTHENLVNKYLAKLQINMNGKKSTVLNLTFNAAVPEKGIDFLNKLIEVYIQAGIDEKNKVAGNTLNFIKDRLNVVYKDLSEIEGDVEKFKTEKGISDISEETRVVLDNVKTYDLQLSQVNNQLNIVESLESFSKEKGSHEMAPNIVGLDDRNIISLIDQLNRFEIERNRLSNATRKDNPLIRTIEAQILDTKNKLEESIKNLKSNLLITQRNISSIIDRYEGKIREVPKTERELLGIKRQQAIKENLYSYLLQKQEETAISLAAAVSDCRIIDSASSSKKPVKPVHSLIYLTGLLLGLILPVGFIYIKDNIDDTVKSKEEVEKETRVSVLGQIPLNKTEDRVILSDKAKSVLAEAFRTLRANLAYVMHSTEKKVILVTSSISGEGKTFVSINLAQSLAMTGNKVIILELDLRKPKVVSYLNKSVQVGLSSYLINAASVEDLIINSGVHENFDLIGCGPIPPNPSELLTGSRIGELITALKNSYDYIIIDTPPIGLVTDALLLSQYSNTSLFIVRSEYTRKYHLKEISELNRSKKFTSLTIVFNGVKTGTSYGYRYGKGYGYNQGYYEEDTPKKGFLKKLRGSIVKS